MLHASLRLLRASVHVCLAAGRSEKALENSFYVLFDYSLEIEFMFIYQKAQHPRRTWLRCSSDDSAQAMLCEINER